MGKLFDRRKLFGEMQTVEEEEQQMPATRGCEEGGGDY